MTFIRKLLDVLNMDNWEHAQKDMQEENIAFFYGAEINENHQNEPVLHARSHDEYTSQSEIIDQQEPIIEELDQEISNTSQSIKPTLESVIQEPVVECNISTEKEPYKSKRMIIKGCHLYFIDISREIIEQNKISIIPLMREYKLSETELKEILSEIYTAGVIDNNNNILMSLEEFERFIDIYEPDLFKCDHTVFDKEIFMCIGEIIFSDSVENVYDSLPADEVIDYLNIMEKLKVIRYDPQHNQYDITSSYDEFIEICKSIPKSYSSTNYDTENISFSNADYDDMTGIEFEKFTAYILSLNNFKNIKVTPASGDHGIDLLAEKDNITYAIQCKCYSANIGNAAVQQAHTGKSLYKRDIAVVLTNQYFTQQAKEEAKALSVKLWDRDVLNNMINK